MRAPNRQRAVRRYIGQMRHEIGRGGYRRVAGMSQALLKSWPSKQSARLSGTKRTSAPIGVTRRNGERDFRGEKRCNETHRSTTDDDARLFRKGDGQQSRLCFIGHVLMENRNGLAVDAELTRAAGAAGALIRFRPQPPPGRYVRRRCHRPVGRPGAGLLGGRV